MQPQEQSPRRSQLHELLAAENDIKTQHNQIRAETIGVLGKGQLFQGKIKTLRMVKPGLDDGVKSSMEAAGSSMEPIGTTVSDRLEYNAGFFKRLVNHRLQKDFTNQNARADIIIDRNVIAESVPATFLLDLESQLASYREIYQAIPTLDIKKDWVRDDQAGEGFWKTRSPEVASKTEKDFQSRVLVAATAQHPAQIEKWNIDITVGHTTTVERSSMWTSAQKAQVLARCDKLILAVKQARARANQTEVERGMDIGEALINFIEAREVTAG